MSHANTLRIASWNVNSVRARLEHLKGWLQAQAPDVLLLQELKGLEFPALELKALGYESAAVTQKAYNGVAVLSRHPIEVVATRLPGDESDAHARYLETKILGLRIAAIYLPNGNPPGSENFIYKLSWMGRLKKQLAAFCNDPVPTLIGGDYNVIPTDLDCYKPASWLSDALFQPEVKALYQEYLQLGYTDAFRSLHPEAQEFTFWDYFRKAFETNRGIRIDHFLLSPALKERLVSCVIDKGPRGLVKPSDHTPIIVELRV